MNALSKIDTGTSTGWAQPKNIPSIDDPQLMTRWQSATQRVAHYAAENNWSKSEVARRSEIATGTFSGWYDGTYGGRYDNVTQRVENFLTSVQEAAEATVALPVEPGFVQTRIARELFECFTYAQALPTMAVVTVGSGLGKTTAAEEFKATRPHVFHITLSPAIKTVNKLMVSIAHQLGIKKRDAVSLEAAIIAALRRDGFSALLIVDEAQNLNEDCINELRTFRDLAKCGIVLLGNDEVTTPYASRDVAHNSPQVARRIGHRLNVLSVYDEDIPVYLDAWGFEDPAIRDVASAIASKPGAFGALSETIKAASMIARGMGRGVTSDDLRAAYRYRGGAGV